MPTLHRQRIRTPQAHVDDAQLLDCDAAARRRRRAGAGVVAPSSRTGHRAGNDGHVIRREQRRLAGAAATSWVAAWVHGRRPKSETHDAAELTLQGHPHPHAHLSSLVVACVTPRPGS